MQTYLEGTKQCLIHTHHSTRVIEFSTVIRRREQSHQLSLREELVPVFDDLQEAKKAISACRETTQSGVAKQNERE